MCSCNGQYICNEVQFTVVLRLQLDCMYLQCVADIKLVNSNKRKRMFNMINIWNWDIVKHCIFENSICSGQSRYQTGQDQPYLLDGELIREEECSVRLPRTWVRIIDRIMKWKKRNSRQCIIVWGHFSS